jgi:outer membrane protein TolC
MGTLLTSFRRPAGLAAVLGAWLASGAARAGEGANVPLSADPGVRELVRASLEKRPEIARIRAQITAEKERVPQSHVLPDPSLSVGIQNDGFSGIQIGKMESSWLFVVASQTFPWFGKRAVRGQLAALGGQAAQIELGRTLLSVTADAERGYLDLLLVREQLGLLAKLERLWQQSEAIVRVRYETGEVAQSDLLRAQLERARLKQRRWALESEERRRVAALNRLRGHDLAEPFATTRALSELPEPVIPDVEQETITSEAASPELKKAQLSEAEAARRVELAKRERLPDITVSAGLMPRWGDFDTMWQAGVSLNLPVWSAHRQARVIAENQARGQAARSGAEAVRQLLALRVRERIEALRALVEANRLYRGGLLTQSEATVSSTLLQYQVGRVAFASVLEALAGYLGDVNGHLESIAAAERIAIAERELSLDPPGGSGSAGVGGAPMPGAGTTVPAAGGASQGPAAEPQTGGAASSSMSRM